MKLYTFTISHFSEKSRWLLDAAGLAYREVPLVPALHLPRTLWLSRRGSSVPILEADDGERIQDSGRILHWLVARQQARLAALLPDEAAAQAEVLAFDQRQAAVGAAVLALVYEPLLDDPALLLRLWTLDASFAQRALLKALLPALLPALRRRFGITPCGLADARERVKAALDELDHRLADGRAFLIGNRFGAADIGVCALLAPLAAPDEHPVYGSAVCRALLGPEALALQARPALQWVRAIYRSQRPPPKPGSALAAARRKLAEG
ncbi:MAG: hypothetical protein NVS9B10_14710 [Nevskia sp.]